MKQIIQKLDTGETLIAEIPSPGRKSNYAIIKSKKTLLSVGTERMLVDFSKSGLLKKATLQPDKVKMVIDKARTDGIYATYETVKSKLDQPLPLGYCNVGEIIDPSDTSFRVGDRVVSNGSHAEIVRVARNLIVKVPNEVDDESAAFTVLGSIAMQGIRLANPTIGETIVVTGLGLIGLLTVQILKANGCRVIGIDFDSFKCDLAEEFGAEVIDLSKGQDPVQKSIAFSRGRGADAVIITASSKSNDIVQQSAMICRKRGRIILVGVVGLEINRSDFYEKELTFQVSCSYGPGRYDEDYEVKGKDYPYPFVRWTEQRNFEAVLDLMASGSINITKLISYRFSFDDAVIAYQKLDDYSSLGILLDYKNSSEESLAKKTVELSENITNQSDKGNVAFVGGGNYASRVLIPAFKRSGANLNTLVTSGGISAVHHGKKNGVSNASTDFSRAIDDDIDTVVIATQHNLHSSQIIKALKHGKHVFVEKPLALSHKEVDEIESVKTGNTILMVGYNRRFAPHIQKIKSLLDDKPLPKTFIMTMNAGEIPSDHWTQDLEMGGGRIIGEACHYIDLMRFLAGSEIESFNAIKMGENNFVSVTEDKALISITFKDGSMGSIHYFANGGKKFPKERIEVFCDNAVLQLDNFRILRGFGWKGFTKMNLWFQNKGQQNCVNAFIKSVKEGEQSPISTEEIFEVARASIDIAEILRK